MGKARPSSKTMGGKGSSSRSKLVSALKNSIPILNTVVASGKISKQNAGKKKSVSFRSNLTDVLAVEQALETADLIKSKLPSKFQKNIETIELMPSSGESSFRRILKSQVKVKKVRQLIKREAFRKKIELLKQAEKDQKEKKRRQQTVIVGDMTPMMEALSSAIEPNSDLDKLQTFVSTHKLQEFQTIPKNKKGSVKKRQKEIADGLEYFASGLKSQSQAQ